MALFKLIKSAFRRPFIPAAEREELHAHRAAGIRGVLGVVGVIFLVFVAFLSSMLVLTPLLEINALEQEKERVQALLRRAQAEEEEAQNIHRWMSSDDEFFENHARDRANQAKDGEIVIRRPTPEEEEARAKAAARERDRAKAEEEKAAEQKQKKPAPRRRRR